MSKKAHETALPKRRFPEFQGKEPWDLLNGNKVFDQITNKNHKSDLPILAITQEHGAIPRELIDYNVVVMDKSLEGYKVVEKGDFIISLRSFQGGIEYSTYKGICSPAYIILRRKKEGTDAYFKHYFKTSAFIANLNKNIEGLRDGKMVSYKQFSELLLPIPSPLEQQKIAAALSSLDALLTAQTAKLTALQAHKRGLMQDLFPAEGETVPKQRFPEFRDAGEWKIKSLGAMFQLQRGFDLPHRLRQNGSVPIISSSGSSGYHSQAIVEAPGVVTGRYGTIGEVFYIEENFWPLNTTLYVKDFKGNVPAFIAHFLKTIDFASYSEKSGVPGVNRNDLHQIKVVCPTTAEQKKIAVMLSSVDNLITAQNQKIEALKLHKKGLMQALFPAASEPAA